MKSTLIIIVALISQNCFAQDTIRVGRKFKRFDQLEMGTTKHIAYNSIDGKLRGISLMTKTTELVVIDQKECVSIKHQWESPGSKWNGNFHFICEPGTMKPIQQIRNTESKGKEAFKFTSAKIVGLDSANDNTQAGFELPLDQPTYNWEVDLETYSLLPMKEGYHAVMNFYHAGGSSKPDFYHLKVAGSEKLALPNGKTLDCWIIFTDYHGSQPTQFWYTKKGQNFVKMEGQYNQMTIHKERIY